MEPTFFDKHPHIKDALNFFLFIALVLIGTLLINTFIFRSFSVQGHSMDKTLANGDRLIVNRLPITAAQVQNKSYVPPRGQVIVFKNPRFEMGQSDEYIVKRVIAFPGERVTVKEGVMKVYTADHPDGIVFDNEWQKNGVGPQQPTSGEVNSTVPEGALFVSGDNRIGSFSFDSRSGLGMIPYYDIVGPVALRIFPFNKISTF